MYQQHTNRKELACKTIYKLNRRAGKIVRNEHEIGAEYAVLDIGKDAYDQHHGSVWDLIPYGEHDIASHQHQYAKVYHNGMIQEAL